MFSFIPTPYNWIAAAVVALALAAGGAAAAHYVDSNVYGKQIATIQLADSKAQTANVSASLNQLQGFIASMHTADADYNAELDAINAQFSTLKKELTNATVHPLPADCKPDVGRLRVLTDAVSAANKAAAAGK